MTLVRAVLVPDFTDSLQPLCQVASIIYPVAQMRSGRTQTRGYLAMITL